MILKKGFRIALILLMMVLYNPEGFGQNNIFTSKTTEFGEENCKWFEPAEGEGDGWQVCEGIDGYTITVYYDFYGGELISIENEKLEFTGSVPIEQCDATQEFANVIEWRYVDGLPIAAIISCQCFAENDQGMPVVDNGLYFVVLGLDGQGESLNFSIDALKFEFPEKEIRKMIEDRYFENQE